MVTATRPVPSDYRPYAEGLQGQFHVPGFVVGQARDGVIECIEGFGQRDREADRPATPDTLYGIGSVTKSFTAVAVLQLMERGRLAIEDPVVRWLPRFRTKDAATTEAMTIHHLLTHTTGMPPNDLLARAMAWDSREPDPEAAPIRTVDDLLDALAEEDMHYVGVPGERLSYSNEGYALLGAIIEEASGVSYPEWVAQHICEPMGLTRTTFRVPSAADDPVAAVYREADDEGAPPLLAPSWRHAPAMLACGFLRSTVPDLLRYLEVFRADGLVAGVRILRPASVTRMVTPYYSTGPGQGYGYGLRITDAASGLRLIEHSGGLRGVSAHVVVVPGTGLTGAALSNLMSAPTGRLALALIHARLGRPLDEPRISYRAEDPALVPPLRPLEGVYTSAEGNVYTVTAGPDTLTISDGIRSTVFHPVGGLGFSGQHPTAVEPVYLQFHQDAEGGIAGLTVGSRVLFRTER